ncbi:MAG: enoyl-CoA hydratase/isomerase family protein [Candidatus Kapabacteria bacterium]|nr:enoyl-CoA hydratase/isomerase family protein [Candidatus Kapabacteria bacterium]
MNTLTLTQENAIATITLNRPDKLNALNTELLSELDTVLDQLANDKDVRCVIITGAGAKAFAAGADIAELHECDESTGMAFAERGQTVFMKIEQFRVPVIAAVNGFALGGGCELALACHIRIASSNAKFGQPEVKLGIIPGYGGTQRLTRLCGTAIAIELICGGGMIDSERALRCGLVNTVVPSEELMNTVTSLATAISTMAPLAVEASLRSIYAVPLVTPHEGMGVEALEFKAVCGTADFKEGTSAFLEKRAATFTGN